MADFFDIFWHDHILGWFWPLVQFLIGLNVVVFIHELGHFLAARWAGVKVERFALGMGPRLFGYQKGDTDYCICALPLGGYVKMLGQDDFAPRDEDKEMVSDEADPQTQQLDPRSYNAATPGKRLVIIAAGVVMNVILAAIMFIIVAMVGHKFPAPYIGGASADFPASKAKLAWNQSLPASYSLKGLQPGDRILKINDKPVETFNDIRKAGAFSTEDEKIKFEIQRKIDGKTYIGKTELAPKYMPEIGLRLFGLAEASSNEITVSSRDLNNSPFKSGDKVVAINNAPIEQYSDIKAVAEKLTGKPITVTVLRKGKKQELKVQPMLLSNAQITKNGDIYNDDDITIKPLKNAEGENIPNKFVYEYKPAGADKAIEINPEDIIAGSNKSKLCILGMTPLTKISAVIKHSPAYKAGLKPGDIIVNYGDMQTPTITQFRKITKDAKGKPLKLTYLRDGKTNTIELGAIANNGAYQIGIYPNIDENNMTIAKVLDKSVAGKAGIAKDSVIKSVNGVEVSNWSQIFSIVSENVKANKPITLVTAQAGKEKSFDLGKLSKKQFSAKNFTFDIFGDYPTSFEPKTITIRYSNPIDALVWGTSATCEMISQSWHSIKKMITGSVSPKAMSGPLGIGKIAVSQAKKDFMDLFYLIAIISASLAFFNFLPIPVLDGGHAVLIIIEMIRRKPLPIKLVNTIQVVGLFLILGLFLTVTFFDITKFF